MFSPHHTLPADTVTMSRDALRRHRLPWNVGYHKQQDRRTSRSFWHSGGALSLMPSKKALYYWGTSQALCLMRVRDFVVGVATVLNQDWVMLPWSTKLFMIESRAYNISTQISSMSTSLNQCLKFSSQVLTCLYDRPSPLSCPSTSRHYDLQHCYW